MALAFLVGENSTCSVPALGTTIARETTQPPDRYRLLDPVPPSPLDPPPPSPAAKTAERLRGPAGTRGLIFPGRTTPWTAHPPREYSTSPEPSGIPPARGLGRQVLARTCPPTPSLATLVRRGRCRRFRGGRSPLPGAADFASKQGGRGMRGCYIRCRYLDAIYVQQYSTSYGRDCLYRGGGD